MENEGLGGLLWFVIWGGLFYFMMRAGGCGGHSHGGHGGHGGHSQGGGDSSGKARDPVCGMEGDPVEAAGSREHMGQTFYFCSANCIEKFDKDPPAYVNPSQKGSHGAEKKHGGWH
jgi:YHS domain-containing protein